MQISLDAVNVCTVSLSSYSNIVERVTSAGIAFITADYRLMPPASGHEVIEDIQDLFTFLASEMNTLLLSRVSGKRSLSCHFDFAINPNALAVAGCSAGGLCAYLAAIHAHPKPKVLIALYAMGGNFLVCFPSNGSFLFSFDDCSDSTLLHAKV